MADFAPQSDVVMVKREDIMAVEHHLATYVEAVELGWRDAEMGWPDQDVTEALRIVRTMDPESEGE